MKSSIIAGSDPFSTHSREAVSLRMLMTYLPGLFTDVSSIVYHGNDCHGHAIALLVRAIQQFRAGMLLSYNSMKAHLPGSGAAVSGSVDMDVAYELLATSVAAIAVADRLLTALGDVAVDLLEKDALFYAEEVLKMEADLVDINGWASYYLRQKASIAASILKTTSIWNEWTGD